MKSRALGFIGVVSVLILIPVSSFAKGSSRLVFAQKDQKNFSLSFESSGIGGSEIESSVDYSAYEPFRFRAEQQHSEDVAAERSSELATISRAIVNCVNTAALKERQSANELFCEGDEAWNLKESIISIRNKDTDHAHRLVDVQRAGGDLTQLMPTTIEALAGRAENDTKIEIFDQSVLVPTAFLYPSGIESVNCTPNSRGWFCNVTVLGKLKWIPGGKRTPFPADYY